MEQTFTPILTANLSSRESYRLLTSIVTPRPIAWVSTISRAGVTNLAPYSFFNAVAGSPPTVMISVGQKAGGIPKDTLRNIEATGEFVVHVVDEAHAELMNQTAGNWEISEFEALGISTLSAEVVKPPIVASAPIALETKLSQLVPIKDTSNVMVLGQVLRFHIRADLLTPDGIIHSGELRPIGRLSGNGYTTLGELFEMQRP